MQGTQYATKRRILCRGAFCGSTMLNVPVNTLTVMSGRFPYYWDESALSRRLSVLLKDTKHCLQ